jgi:hypothetical protein
MWRLMHKLFGWDYVQWRNATDQGIARVHVEGTGRVWYWRYKGSHVADVIADRRQVLWLTCKPGKYMQQDTSNKQEGTV